MSFARPTLAQIIARVSADFVSRLELVGAVLLVALVNVLTRVIAGSEHMLHGHLEFLGRQLFPDQSDDAYLVRQASLYGITKNPASYAVGTITITGTDTTIVPAGTILTDAEGAEYTVDAEVEIGDSVSGEVEASVTSSLAGADYTLVADQVLTFQSPISGADSTAIVGASTEDGTDEETTEALRVRLLERMQEPAHGGTEADYIAWAKEVAGVTRVWVEPLGLGAGTVLVRFVRDDDGGGLIPSGGEVTAVQDYIDERAPAHATVTVVAPTEVATAFTIAIEPDTSPVRAAVQAELDDLYRRDSEPAGTILLSRIRTAIGNAAGLEDYTLTVPAADVTHTAGQLPTRGTITWA